jgi:nucleoside-diphosphate-sugar epimerase
MRCVVTGAAGFVGSHLSERLVRDGHEVVGVDCFTDYYPRATKEGNLATLREGPRFELRELNIADADLEALVDGADVVFHQAV